MQLPYTNEEKADELTHTVKTVGKMNSLTLDGAGSQYDTKGKRSLYTANSPSNLLENVVLLLDLAGDKQLWSSASEERRAIAED